MAYQAKDSLVLQQQLKVQSLVIPFVVTGSATSGSVVISNDAPGVCFFQSTGTDQITAALATGETATYTTTMNDSTGIVNILIKLNQPAAKLVKANVKLRDTGVDKVAYLGSATGITTGTGGGSSLMIGATIGAFNSAVSINGCLEVSYSTVS